ncbi:hypothetical protein F4780DRAFT_456590 [Xylariomycetidae sp. FL0641]|nr:hypothetical protein F4780DRAFT_456590 [Xylariomycetidae sp. FL0641]
MDLPFPSPASLSPEFAMSCATMADLDPLVDVYFAAFSDSPGMTYWWSSDPQQQRAWMQRRVKRKLADRSVRHFKIVETSTGEVIAWSRWDIPAGYEASFGDWIGEEMGGQVDVSRIVKSEDGADGAKAKEGQDGPVLAAPVETSSSDLDVPEGAVPELFLDFFGRLKQSNAKWNAKEMLGLSILCTTPKHHRRGAGKALLLPMLDIADAAGLCTYLEGTDYGKPLYEKLGFKVVDEIHYDLPKLTNGRFNEPYTLYVMIREPKSP